MLYDRYNYMQTKTVLPSLRSGFTLVELLIVIVVIAILAAITIVAFNSVQQNAVNANKVTNISQWQKLFQLYNAQYARYPTQPAAHPRTSATNTYCLGKNFKWDACWNVYDVMGTSGTYGSGPFPGEQIAHEDAGLMTELEKVGTLPGNAYCLIGNYCATSGHDGVGPFVTYENGKPVKIGDFFFTRDGKCPSNMIVNWSDAGAAHCEMLIR